MRARPIPVLPAVASRIVAPGPLQAAILLRALDHSNGCTVLHAAARIQVLQFCKNVSGALWDDAAQVQHGSPAH